MRDGKNYIQLQGGGGFFKIFTLRDHLRNFKLHFKQRVLTVHLKTLKCLIKIRPKKFCFLEVDF